MDKQALTYIQPSSLLLANQYLAKGKNSATNEPFSSYLSTPPEKSPNANTPDCTEPSRTTEVAFLLQNLQQTKTLILNQNHNNKAKKKQKDRD